jgi:type IV pilus assembly protein PilC
MNFKYTAYTPQKKIVKGALEVSDKGMAVETLERAGYNILSLKPVRRINPEDILPGLYTVKKGEVVLFSRQLAMLLEKGVRFLSAIELAKDQVKNRLFKKKLGEIVTDVESGSTFSDAVARHPDIFPVTYHHMMKVGEKSGKLEVVLREVAQGIEQDEASMKRLRGAFTYPGIIFAMGIVTVAIMITTVLPSLTNLYSRFETELPLPTRITIAVSDFLTAYGLYVIIGFLVLALAVIWYSRKPSGKYYLEKFLMAIPVVGRILFLRNLYQFSRISAIMLNSGLPIPEVIEVAQDGVQSETIRRELQKIPASLMQGYGLSRAMRESTLFPTMLVQMVITGEETNTLEQGFEALAEHYDFEFNQSMNSFISLLEPVLIAVIGLFIGFVAISSIMPIYSIYGVIS